MTHRIVQVEAMDAEVIERTEIIFNHILPALDPQMEFDQVRALIAWGLTKPLVAAPPFTLTDEHAEPSAQAIFAKWAKTEGSNMTWDDAIKAATEPAKYPNMVRVVSLCRTWARAALTAFIESLNK